MSLFSNFPQSPDAEIKEEIAALKNRVQPVDKGGTGATTAAQALANLGGIAAGAVGNLHVWGRVQSGVTDYLTSTGPDAYTEGTVDNTTITYLGQLGEGARIEVGSYVGTGTFGSALKNSLTFGFEPKFVYIARQIPNNDPNAFRPHVWFWVKGCGFMFNNANYSGSSDVELAYCTVTQADKTLAWYNSKSIDSQANKVGTYNYIAIG